MIFWSLSSDLSFGCSKQIRKRDLASRDARIRADYFGPNLVYSAFQFLRRCVLRIICYLIDSVYV
jgi:hypothetical protein